MYFIIFCSGLYVFTLKNTNHCVLQLHTTWNDRKTNDRLPSAVSGKEGLVVAEAQPQLTEGEVDSGCPSKSLPCCLTAYFFVLNNGS